MDLLDKKIEVTRLFDIYGELLTDRQYEFMCMHLNDDLNLVEIAQNYNISKQSVYESINSGILKLQGFEQKIGFVAHIDDLNSKIDDILKSLNSKMDKSEFSQVESALHSLKM